MGQWIGSRTIDVELIDGEKHSVTTIFADSVAYESTARKHGWGTGSDAPLNTIAFVCWHALRRTGDVPVTVTFEAFRDRIVQVRPEGSTDDPTPPAPRPG